MEDTQVLVVCLVAFGAVFTILTFLAIVMNLLVALFPERKAQIDEALVAAISSSVSTLLPGARVTRIEEE